MALGRLGNGPFTVEAVLWAGDPDCLADVAGLMPEKIEERVYRSGSPYFACDCCGSTALKWPVFLTNASDDWFIVGRKCAANAASGVDPRKLADMKHAAERKERDFYFKSEEFTTWLKGAAHPKGWSGKSRLDDVRYWTMRKAPKMSLIRKAWREWKDALDKGLVSPDGVTHIAEWHALADFREAEREALKSAAHPMASKRGFKRKKLSDYVEYMLDAKATEASALERALILAKNGLGLGPSLAEIEAEKVAARKAAEKEAAEKEAAEKAKIEPMSRAVMKAYKLALDADEDPDCDAYIDAMSEVMLAKTFDEAAVAFGLICAKLPRVVEAYNLILAETADPAPKIVRKCSDCGAEFDSAELRDAHEDRIH